MSPIQIEFQSAVMGQFRGLWFFGLAEGLFLSCGAGATGALIGFLPGEVNKFFGVPFVHAILSQLTGLFHH